MEIYSWDDKFHKFESFLVDEEKSPGTIRKYIKDVEEFAIWLRERELTKEAVTFWRDLLLEQGLKPCTVNGKLASLHCFLKMEGRNDIRVKSLKVQRRLFREEGRELSKLEYEALLREARKRGNRRLELTMETICATGIRVSELKYITMEATSAGRAEVALKGKIRVIMIPAKLCRKLSKYAKEQGIVSGEIFLSRRGTGLSRKRIWGEMKELCKDIGIEPTKVFPHNLRHLFARCFYRVSRDLTKLADVLGHSSVETTRIYLVSTGEEHAQIMARLKLIS